MDRVPIELADLVVTYCDFTSLKHLRLTNNLYRDAATPLVFQHFYMGYFPHHLENLCHVAKSPLAKHVKRFTIFSDLIPDWSKREWLDKIDFRPNYWSWSGAPKLRTHNRCATCADKARACPRCREANGKPWKLYAKLPRHQLTDEQLDAAWSRHEDYRISQSAWREDREGIIFQEHVAMLPNLIEAHLICATSVDCPVNELPVWKRLSKEILIGRNAWVNGNGRDADMNAAGQGPDLHVAEGQAALCLLEAVGYRAHFAGTKQITKLSIQNTHRQSYMDLLGVTVSQGGQRHTELTTPSHRLRYQNVMEAFRHLTDLKFHVSRAASSEMMVAQETRAFLRAATELKRLDLEHSDEKEREHLGVANTHFLFDFFDSGGEGTTDNGNSPYWPHLEHLALLTNVAHPQLLDFLRRHASTLRSLELRDMIVEDVRALLSAIPKVLALEHVYLECIWGTTPGYTGVDSLFPYSCYLGQSTDHKGVYEEKVRAYLLRQAEKLPALLAESEDGE